ncbi:MAG: HEAT repeat domain-containing protein [Actinomycetota bacterium]
MSKGAEPGRVAVVRAGHEGDARTARAGLTAADPAVRALALGAARRCSCLTAADIRSALGDDEPLVRRRAAEEAAGLGDPAVGGALRDALTGPDAGVVEMAAWALGELPPDASTVAALGTVARTHDESLCREAAVAALGALGHRDGLGAILDATTDKATVRRRAVLALAPFDGIEVERALTRAREDRDWQVRQAAEDLLGG